MDLRRADEGLPRTLLRRAARQECLNTMAWPVATVLNISNSGYYWQDRQQSNTIFYSLTSEDLKNGTIDPYLLAATTVLHLLVSASRRLLSTEISAFEYLILVVCIAAATIEEGIFLLLLVRGKDHTSPFFGTLNGFLFMCLNIILHGIS